MNPSFFFLGSLFSFMMTGACACTTIMSVMRTDLKAVFETMKLHCPKCNKLITEESVATIH